MALDQHDLDEDGEHFPEDSELCLEQNCSVSSVCRCGHCCERLILECSLRDAEREPRIATECDRLREIDDATIGFLLNDRSNGFACHFFDRANRVCTIYDTRPLMCRVFDCDRERVSDELSDLLSTERSTPDIPPTDDQRE